MNSYDWIIFDSTGTLMTPDPEPASVYQATAQQLGSQLPRDEIRANLRAAMRRHFFGSTAFEPTTQEVERDRWQKIVADTLPDLAGESLATAFRTLWQHFASPQTWRLYDDVPISIERLKAKGYRVAVASNFDGRLRTVLEGMPIRDRFDAVLISSDLGWSKPNPQFYLSAAQCLGATDLSKLLMIGDTELGDVVAAKRAGLDARHLVRDRDDALAVLTQDL